MNSENPKAVHPDWQLVLAAGGPAAVARKLGYSGMYALQRVQNWKQRGVPAEVKLNHPRLFPHKPVRGPQVAQPCRERAEASDCSEGPR